MRFSQCTRRSVGSAALSLRHRRRHRCLSMGGVGDTERVTTLLTKGRVEGWLMNRYGGVSVRSLDAAAWIHDEMVRSPGRLGDHIGWKVGVDAAGFQNRQRCQPDVWVELVNITRDKQRDLHSCTVHSW